MFSFPLYLLLLSYQAVQLTHILGKRLSEPAEEIERERVLKDVANATTRDKVKAAEIVEKKAQASEKAQLVAERKLTEVEGKLGGVELKLAEVASLGRH